MFAVGEVEAGEGGAADHGAWGRLGGSGTGGAVGGGTGGLETATTAGVGRRRNDDLAVVALGGAGGRRLGDHPAYYARKQVVADLAAVGPVDFLETFGVFGHFEDL